MIIPLKDFVEKFPYAALAQSNFATITILMDSKQLDVTDIRPIKDSTFYAVTFAGKYGGTQLVEGDKVIRFEYTTSNEEVRGVLDGLDKVIVEQKRRIQVLERVKSKAEDVIAGDDSVWYNELRKALSDAD